VGASKGKGPTALETELEELQTEAQTKISYTDFRDSANLAQDALKAAEAASCRAGKEQIAAVGALLMTWLQLPGAPAVLEPLKQLESNCRDQVQALTEEILRRGATATAAAKRAQRREKEAGAEASRAATQPGTMPPPSTPTRAVAAPATPAGPQPLIESGVSGGGPATIARPKPRRPQGLGPRPKPASPAPVTEPSARMEFNAQMSNEYILEIFNRLLPDWFNKLPEVIAEFAEGHLAPLADAQQIIARRCLKRDLTNEDLDEGFYVDRKLAIHNLIQLWRRPRQEEHQRRPPHERPRLAQLPLPVKEWEEQLDN
jgi:hypothetical protein